MPRVSRGAAIVSAICIVMIPTLTGLVAQIQPQFEVVSIKPNAQGFIDLGGGVRLLRGETRCHAADAASIPGDPLPPAAPGRCVIRNSTVKEMIDVAFELRSGPIRSVLNQMIRQGSRPSLQHPLYVGRMFRCSRLPTCCRSDSEGQSQTRPA